MKLQVLKDCTVVFFLSNCTNISHLVLQTLKASELKPDDDSAVPVCEFHTN